MPSRKRITIESVEKLGAAELARIVVEHCAGDPLLRKRMTLALAAGESGPRLAAEIDKRIAAIARSRSFVDWEKRKDLARDLDSLRTEIATTLARTDPRGAATRMEAFLRNARRVIDRVDGNTASIDAVFDQALDDLGRLWAAVPGREPGAMADLALRLIEDQEFAVGPDAVPALGEAMGVEGQRRLADLLRARLRALPPAKDRDWEAAKRRHVFAGALAELADLAGDVDSYIAAARAGGGEASDALEIARRLLAAGRAEEALRRVEAFLPGAGYEESEAVDLLTEALDRLDRNPEAQRARWAFFEKSLSLPHLKAYLKRLPDFEDVEAQDRAVAHAAAFADAHAALAFLVELPDLIAAERLVRTRLAELDGREYPILTAAAGRLVERRPLAATLLYRRMIESILDRASSAQYSYAVRDVRECESLAGRLPAGDGIESHDDFMQRLKAEHGRKWGFWSALDKG